MPSKNSSTAFAPPDACLVRGNRPPSPAADLHGIRLVHTPRRRRIWLSGILRGRRPPRPAGRSSRHLFRRLRQVVHRRHHVVDHCLVFAGSLRWLRFHLIGRDVLRRRMSYCVAIETRPLELVPDKPDAQHTRDLVVVKVSVLTASTVITGPPDFKMTRSPGLKMVICET